jgi:hypothetical protein
MFCHLLYRSVGYKQKRREKGKEKKKEKKKAKKA